MVRDSELRDVRALTFDIFGTTVDWRTGVAAQARRLGALNGVEADWDGLAGAWRALYMPSMDRVRRGEVPWTNFDRLHRASLDQVLREVGAEGFDEAARDELTLAWERLPPWPLLSAEDFRHYKPDPEVYLGAAAALGLEVSQVMMVAAHKPDLRAAQAAGMRAAFVERSLEKGPGGGADLLPDPLAHVQATDFLDLANQLGC